MQKMVKKLKQVISTILFLTGNRQFRTFCSLFNDDIAEVMLEQYPFLTNSKIAENLKLAHQTISDHIRMREFLWNLDDRAVISSSLHARNIIEPFLNKLKNRLHTTTNYHLFLI